MRPLRVPCNRIIRHRDHVADSSRSGVLSVGVPSHIDGHAKTRSSTSGWPSATNRPYSDASSSRVDAATRGSKSVKEYSTGSAIGSVRFDGGEIVAVVETTC